MPIKLQLKYCTDLQLTRTWTCVPPTCEHTLRRRRLREGNHVPDGMRAGEQHGEAIEAEGHAAMRGGTILEAVQQVAELGLKGGVRICLMWPYRWMSERMEMLGVWFSFAATEKVAKVS